MDRAGAAYGDRVYMVSSLDPDHSADNIIDGNHSTYWISTGLYPQEVILELDEPTMLSSIKVATTHVRRLRVEGCHSQQPVSFAMVTEAELENTHGSLQISELPCSTAQLKFVRVIFVAGWDDFCTCHNLFLSRPGKRRVVECHRDAFNINGGHQVGEGTPEAPESGGLEDRQYWLNQVEEDWQRLARAPAAIRADREVALSAVAQDRRALEYVEASVRTEIAVILGVYTSKEQLPKISPPDG
mmetsp:Transcript_144606/g.266715  ORF Transcript_144606/g.266715 Transcript_144606/m.266715 type:complete len:243 (+) Transcript_144606:93-821(+)